jgi:hypothetical protein
VGAAAGSFTVRAQSNLSVLVHPSRRLGVGVLGRDSRDFEFGTFGILNNPTALPHAAFLTARTRGASRVVALGSGSDMPALLDSGGDAMLGIYLDRRYPGSDRMSWSVNDHWTGAELAAPLFVHSIFSLRGRHTVSLDASEMPWRDDQGEDTARYRVARGARLVALLGGMRIAGSASSALTTPETSPWDFVGVGSSTGFPGVPAAGTDVLLAASSFRVPERDSGVVLFTAKSRVQGDEADEGGRVSLWLELDGRRVGSVGVQRLGPQPYAVSERSICASYLAAGARALTAGRHEIRVFGRVDGSFLHLAMVADLPLVFFD